MSLSAPVGVAGDRYLYLEEQDGVTTIKGTGPLVGLCARTARLGNNGVLAGWAHGAAAVLADHRVVRDGGSGPEELGVFPEAIELAVNPEGRVALLMADAVWLEGHRGGLLPLPPGIPSGLSFVGTDRLAVTLTEPGYEPWQRSRVCELDLGGAILDEIGSAVEPRDGAGELFVLAERGVGFAPGPARCLVPADEECGEVPLGAGRSSYLVGQDGVLVNRTAVESAGLVRPDGSFVRRGSLTSLTWIASEPAFLEGSLVDGIALATPSAVLARARRRRRIEAIEQPLSPRGIPGLLYVPEVVRGSAILVHGGPIGNVTRFPNPKVAWLVDHGFAVALPDYSGSFGYGSDYRERLHHRFGVVEVDELEALCARMREDFGSPVIGLGSSSAGYSLLRCAERNPGALEAIVLSAPLVELDDSPELAWLAPTPPPTPIVVPEGPWVLLTHGTEDRVVPIEATRRLVGQPGAPRRLRFSEFSGEGHSYSRDGQLRELALMSALMREAGFLSA